MPYKRKGSPYWWVKISSGGQVTRRSTGTTDRAAAEKVEAEWRRPTQGHLFDTLLAEYLTAKPSERAGFAVLGLTPWFGGKSIESITPADLLAYRRGRGASEGTIIRELGVLRAAIRYCRTHLGWNLPDPTKGRIPEPPPHRIRWLTKDEYRRLLEAAQRSSRAPWLAPFIVLAVNTGMRRGELLGLEWRRVDLDAGLVYLDPEHQKGRRSSTVPLNKAARAALQELKRRYDRACTIKKPADDRVFPIASVKKSFAFACKTAGLTDVRVHDLRHTCAARLVQAGVPLRTVSEILRHKDIRTTMRYAHLSPEDARSGLAMLDE